MPSTPKCPAEPPPLSLGELRRNLGLAQVELATRLGIRQPHAAKIEHQTDMLLSTLRRYVAGMGCELQLVVRHPRGNREIILAGSDGRRKEAPPVEVDNSQTASTLPPVSAGAAMAHGCCPGWRPPAHLAPVIALPGTRQDKPANKHGKDDAP